MLIRLLAVQTLIAAALLPGAPSDRVQVTLDTSEADQVLAILAMRGQNQPVPDAEWQKLFATVPYQRLKQREKAVASKLHNPAAAFTDDAFKRFVLSDPLLARAARLTATMERWKKADLTRDAERVLAYLPAAASLRARVFTLIKPSSDSFVWDLSTDPTIFLYLEPGMKGDKFENNVAHDLYHIGLSSIGPAYNAKIAALPAPARTAAEWMSSFSEGVAVLAAAGGPHIDPHAVSSVRERARWKQDMSAFDSDLSAVNQFFLDIVNQALTGRDAVQAKGRSFYGVQGPWYTVGYKMAVMVEKRFGRPALIDSTVDARCLLVLYNRAAAEQNSADNPTLPLWSPDLLSAVQAGNCGQP